MCDILSLLPHCQKCGSKCCIPGETIGLPIVSEEEVREALMVSGILEGDFQKIVLSGGKYYYVPVKTSAGRCVFLTAKNQCAVQDAKFNDCREYPIKPSRQEGKIVFVVDIHCPAAPHLTREFIARAKEVGFKLLAAWDPMDYQHWLDRYIQWTKDAWELEAYLKLTEAEKLAFQVY